MFTFLNYDQINKSKVNVKVNYPNKSTLSIIILFLKPGFIPQANIWGVQEVIGSNPNPKQEFSS